MEKDYCEILLEAVDTLLVSKTNEILTTFYTDTKQLNNQKGDIPKADIFSDITQEVKYSLINNIQIGVGEKKQYGELNLITPVSFTKLGIIGQFTVLNATENKGNFGIELKIVTGSKTRYIQFDSSEMFVGNMLFVTDLLQKALYDLSGIGKIKSISMSLYNNTTGILTATNCNFILGSDIKQYTETDKTIEIYMAEDDTNNYSIDNTVKNIYLRWIYGAGDQYKSVTHINPKECPPEASIRWYRYNQNANVYDAFGGLGWEHIEEADKAFNITINNLNINLEQEQFKVVIITGEGKIIETSNILTIKRDNQKESGNFPIYDLQLIYLDGSNGIYNYYNYDNIIRLEDAWRLNVPRILKCSFASQLKDEQLYAQLSKITWQLPTTHIICDLDSTAAVESLSNGYTKYTIDLADKISKSDDKAQTLQEACQIKYRINSNRDREKPDGQILCTIEFITKEKISAEKLISLKLFTNTKEDYVVVNKLLNKFNEPQTALAPSFIDNIEEKAFYLLTRVFNSEGKELTLGINSRVEIIEQTETLAAVTSPHFILAAEENSSQYIDNRVKFYYCPVEGVETHIAIIKQLLAIEDDNGNQITTIEAYFGIPLVKELGSSHNNNQYTNKIKYRGPLYVRYNGLGANPEYSHLPISLLNENGDNLVQQKIEVLENRNFSFMPKINLLSNGDQILVPKNTYDNIMSFNNKICCIKLTTISISGMILYWYQPIPIYQDKFQSTLINNWDGALSIDENANKILTASLVAGKMESGQDFTGVIVGAIGENNAGLENTGIFGFNKGQGVYAFKDDGTATIGASGAGQLQFDGNMGIIQSGNFDGTYERSITDDGEYVVNLKNIGTTGSLFDLTNGYLIANNSIFRGELEVPIGIVGGWTISPSGLFSMKTDQKDNKTKNVVRAGLFIENLLAGTPCEIENLTKDKYLALAIGMPDRDMTNASEKDWEEISIYDGARHFSDLIEAPSAELMNHYKIWNLAESYYVDVNIMGLPHPDSIVFNDLYYNDLNDQKIPILKNDYQATFKGLNGNVARFYIEWNGNYTDLANKYYQKTVSQASVSWRNTLPNYQVFDTGYVYSRFGTLGTYYAKNLYIEDLYTIKDNHSIQGLTTSIYMPEYYISSTGQNQPAQWLNFYNGILIGVSPNAEFESIKSV